VEETLRDGLGAQTFLSLETNLGASARTKVLQCFREQEGQRVLLASDLAARGVDVPDITHVVHFDLPDDGEVSCYSISMYVM
jgi:ATP-dependent RNA helicase DeaD